MQLSAGGTASTFVSDLRPALERRDLREMMRLLKTRYPVPMILQLLESNDSDARKVAAMSLAWIGCQKCIEPLVSRLKDPDPMVHMMAEHALWSIWLRGGSKAANQKLCRAIQSMEAEDYDLAIRLCDQALELSPEFPEALNQRAIAYYLKEDYRASITDCLRAIALTPCHFGAWSGLGHCHAHLNAIPQAINAYMQALNINPHMECVRESLKHLNDLQRPS